MSLIQIKYSAFKDHAFNSGLKTIAKFRGFNTKALYDLSKVLADIKAGQAEVQKQYVELVKEYAELDDKGEFVPNSDPTTGDPIPGSFIVLENKRRKYQAAAKEFEEKIYVINREKLKLIEAEELGLSLEEFEALEPIRESADKPIPILIHGGR